MTSRNSYVKIKLSKERKLRDMYEFEILLENGSTDNISGYSYEDALFRSRRKPEEVVKVLNREYVD